MSRATETQQARLAPRFRFQARLFGGEGDGTTLQLDDFAPRISVYRNSGPAFAFPGEPVGDESDGAALIGVYDLVEPIGSEMPIYVAGS